MEAALWGSASRRTINDDNIRVPSTRVKLKPEYRPSGSFSSRQGLGGGGNGSGSVNSYAGKVNEAGSVVGVSSQNLGGNSGGYTNVWATRKEVMHHINRKKKGKCGEMALKLDMSKAYDRVEWSCLQQRMANLRFHENWTSLVMRCVSSITYEVRFNGKPCGQIIPTRGLC